ncbi:MAG TPA: transposase, partial [Firmicutes bacterium]|nr:transposase [Bacillota bacterium]
LELAREEGIERGIEQGIEKGIEQGSKQTRLENAKVLIANGIDKSIVIKSLNLNEDEIKELA